MREITIIVRCGITTVEMNRKSAGNDVRERKSGRPYKSKSRDNRAITCSTINDDAKMAVEMTTLIENDREDKVSIENLQRAL